jgi:YidC/Oxa1 family membrane protein insertase
MSAAADRMEQTAMDPKTFREFLIVAALIFAAWYGVRLLAPDSPRPGPSPERQIPLEPAPPRPPETPSDVEQEPDIELEEDIVLGAGEDDLLRTTWTNRGAALQSLELTDLRAPYVDRQAGQRPVLTLLREFEAGMLSDVIESVTFAHPEGVGTPTIVRTAEMVYHVAERNDAAQQQRRIVFRSPTIDGGDGRRLEIVKTVGLEPGARHLDVTLRFENMSPELDYRILVALRGPAGIEREELRTRFIGTHVGVAEGDGTHKIAEVTAGKLSKLERKGEDYPHLNQSTNIAWAAVVNHYFAGVIQPRRGSWIREVESRLISDADIEQATGRWQFGAVPKPKDRPDLARLNAAAVVHTTPLSPNGGELAYRFIAVPKDTEILRLYGDGLSGLVRLGWPEPVSRLMLALLNALHSLARNYGVAILLLTVVVRAALHPLTRKSQVGMIKMQKLQPMTAELQKRHGNDRQKLTEEQMALFKKYGVSPFGGCMPMLLQMPILIALFKTLRQAYVLRQAGFLYIDDLSRPDTIAILPFSIPFLGNQVNILPVIMTVLMLVQQKFMHQPAATEQARQQQAIFKWMPLLFGLLFYRMPSGLCLYWTTSMGIGIVERWLVERKHRDVELKPVDQTSRKPRSRPSAAPGTPEKKGWLGKLQRMVEEQNKRATQLRGKGKNNRRRK